MVFLPALAFGHEKRERWALIRSLDLCALLGVFESCAVSIDALSTRE